MVDHVAWVAEREKPVPTSSEFSFSVIMHVAAASSSNGAPDSKVTTLLTAVTRLADSSNQPILATPAVSRSPDWVAVGSQGAEPFAHRISTAAFGFASDLPGTGAFGSTDPKAPLTFTIEIDEHDRLNPFRHKFHPDHDCDSAGECQEITRTLGFVFKAPDSMEPGLEGTYA